MSPASYLAAPPRDIVDSQRKKLSLPSNSLIIILKTNVFVNCFFVFFKKILKFLQKLFFAAFALIAGVFFTEKTRKRAKITTECVKTLYNQTLLLYNK